MLRPIALTIGRTQALCAGSALVAGLATVATGTSSSMKWTDCESSTRIPSTLDGSIRLMRLVKTVGSIVIDYETAKISKWLNLDSFTARSSSLEADDLLKRIEQYEGELADAQRQYSRIDTDEAKNLSAEEKRTIKLNEKKAMEDAAARLAEAQSMLESQAIESESSKVHQRAAHRLLKLCHENGGVYIKIGQHIANLDYLVPQEYINVLSTLFNEAPQSSYKDVERVFREEFGKSVEDLFESFDPKPIASASLAQVHVAYDKETGRKLAVKVQHAGLQDTSAGDIAAVTAIVRLVDRLFVDFTFGWIADEIAPYLPKELDFKNEARNSEIASEYLKRTKLNCIIPEVIWKHTTGRVLTMAYEEGFKITDQEAIDRERLDRRAIARLVSSVFSSQVFESGFVHCDPHECNLLVRRRVGRPQLVLVDHGLYRHLDDGFRLVYAKLWKALMLSDLPGIKDTCKEMGIDEAYPLFAAMLTARPFDEIIEQSKTRSLQASKVDRQSKADQAIIRGYAQEFLSDILSLLGTIPPQMLLLLKMNDCLRHIDHSLGSPVNNTVVTGHYASRVVCHHALTRPGATVVSRCAALFEYFLIWIRIRTFEITTWFSRVV